MELLNKEDVKKLARKVWKHHQGMKSVSIMHPTRDWLVGVGIAVMIIILSGAWSVSRYIDNKTIATTLLETDVEAGAVLYRESLVAQALNIFAERQRTVEALLAGRPVPATTEPSEQGTVEEDSVSDSADAVQDETDSNTPVVSTGAGGGLSGSDGGSLLSE